MMKCDYVNSSWRGRNLLANVVVRGSYELGNETEVGVIPIPIHIYIFVGLYIAYPSLEYVIASPRRRQVSQNDIRLQIIPEIKLARQVIMQSAGPRYCPLSSLMALHFPETASSPNQISHMSKNHHEPNGINGLLKYE